MSESKYSLRWESFKQGDWSKYPYLKNFPLIWKRRNDGYSNGIITVEKDKEIVGVTLLYYHDISKYIDIDIMEVRSKNIGIGKLMLEYLKKISDKLKVMLSVHPMEGTKEYFIRNGFREGDKYVLPLIYGDKKWDI